MKKERERDLERETERKSDKRKGEKEILRKCISLSLKGGLRQGCVCVKIGKADVCAFKSL